jgi:hypothetical protein
MSAVTAGPPLSLPKRMALAVLFLPTALFLCLIVVEFSSARFLGKWFSVYWITALRLTFVAGVCGVLVGWGVPRVFRRWWGLWLAAGITLNAGALFLLLSFAAFGESRALTTASCSKVPMLQIRSCRHWSNNWTTPNELTLARGSLPPKLCQASSAVGSSATGKCEIEKPETWLSVNCASVGLPKAVRCFRCDFKEGELGSHGADDVVKYTRVLALVSGCGDAIYFAGDGAGLDDMKGELSAL